MLILDIFSVLKRFQVVFLLLQKYTILNDMELASVIFRVKWKGMDLSFKVQDFI